jgi:hypothetical protein
MNRKKLEKEALKNVCACFYYDLTNAMEDMTDSELWRIVKHNWWGHIEQQLNQPVPLSEFYELLADCDAYMSSGEEVKIIDKVRG